MNPSALHPAAPLSWKKSVLWLALSVACFHLAYFSVKFPAAGFFLIGYALGLVKLTAQPNVRCAFYLGLVTGFLCYAPQLAFFFRIFSVAAVLLWLVLAFWVGLFVAIACGCRRRWGDARAVWFIPFLWTGIEYFRSELYFLKFSWLNVGYAFANFPMPYLNCGMYAVGLLVFAVVSYNAIGGLHKPGRMLFFFVFFFALTVWTFVGDLSRAMAKPSRISIVGIQLEFPPANILPQVLNQALAKSTNAQIFVLSEYTLTGPPTEALKAWCRTHEKYLVVGGEVLLGSTNYYNTAFVIGPTGDVVFQQTKSVPIQFFRDGLPAQEQKIWDSPWGKIGICICYDLSYTRVTDELVRQGAQLLIVPTMDVETWGRHQHELHSRVAPVRAAEYGIPIFRLASSGISQAVSGRGQVKASTPMPGNGDMMSASLRLPAQGNLPLDRWLAPACTGFTAWILAWLLWLSWRERRSKTVAVKFPA